MAIRIPELFDLYRSRAKGSPAQLEKALRTTWEDPAAFRAELFRHGASRGARPPRSIVDESYDLYHDGVLRHTGEARIALRWYDAEHAVSEMTFGELHARAGRLAEIWAEAGVEEGGSVAIIAPPGPDRCTALFAAFRLGLVATILPTLGDRITPARVAALKPDHVAVAPHHAWLAKGLEKAILPETDGLPPAPDETSTAYAALAPCLNIFSPLSQDPLAPTPVTAADAYMGALRDASLAFGIGPGDAMAAPGVNDLQHQPALLLSAALAGATWIEMPLEIAEEDPRRLRERPLACLGVPRELRELLLRKPVDLAGEVAHLWTPLDDALEAERIEELRRAVGLGKEGASSALVDAALGGAVLLSSARYAARYDSHHASAMPAAGLTHELIDATGGGKSPQGNVGRFAVAAHGAKEATPTSRILMRREGDWFDVAHVEPRRFGRAYPAALVEAALDDLPFVVQAVTAPLPSPGAPTQHEFVLLIFVGPRPQEEIDDQGSRWEDFIREAVRRRIGEEHVPDRIELYPFFARRGKKGVLEADWVRAQRGSGGLRRRTKSTPQRLIAEIKSAAVYGRADAASFLDRTAPT